MNWRGVAASVVVLLLWSGGLSAPHVADPGAQSADVPARPAASPSVVHRSPSVGPIAVRPGIRPGPVASSEPFSSVRDPPASESATIGSQTPWGTGPVVVAINDSAAGNRSVTPLVAESLSYWEENDVRYGRYAAHFELQPDAEDPDVVVRFLPEVVCHGETGWLGCAPVYNATDRVDGPSYVDVKTGYTNDSTVETLEHEFGHVLGIRHGDPPMPLMESAHEGVQLPQPNVSERANPWRTDNLTVYVDYSGVDASQRDTVRSQIGEALSYYENGADGYAPENVTFETVTKPAGADVLIEFPADPDCRDGPGSCGRNYGRDVDHDGRLEYFTQTRIEITGVQPEAVGWHVGYWIGSGLGATNRSELPPPFRADGNRRGDWWT